jgi:hypothetical protein
MQAPARVRNRGEIAVRVDVRAIFKRPYATFVLCYWFPAILCDRGGNRGRQRTCAANNA